MRRTYDFVPEFRAIDPREYRHLDLDFYDDAKRELERLGYRHVGDVSSTQFERVTPNPRTFMRLHLSADGTSSAAIYHIRPRFYWRIAMFFMRYKLTRLVEFQSELVNEYQISTTTVQPDQTLPPAPQLRRHSEPIGTPIKTLAERHHANLRAACEEFNAQPTVLRSLDELLELEKRQTRMQRDYFESQGWLPIEWLIAQNKGNAKIAQEIYDEAQQILAEEAAQKER